MKIPSICKLTAVLFSILVCNISTAQEPSTAAYRLIEIPHQKSDNSRTPPKKFIAEIK